MTPELERLRALSEAATPGRWGVNHNGSWEGTVTGPGLGYAIARVMRGRRSENAAFIVAAVNYVRDLLARDSAEAGLLEEAADELARNPSVLVSRDGVVAALRSLSAAHHPEEPHE